LSSNSGVIVNLNIQHIDAHVED